MNERELTLFSALTDIGDDLVLESGAFVPAVGGGASSSAEAGTAIAGRASSARGAGKDGRSPWFIPATVAACAALIAVIGILVGVVGNAFGFFPTKPPEVTTEEVVTDAPTDQATEEPTEEPTAPPTEEPTDGTTEEPEPPVDDGVTLPETPDAGLAYQDKLIFVGDSLTAHLINHGVLTDGKETKQVWRSESNVMNLNSEITSVKIIYPETGEKMTVAQAAGVAKPEIMIITLGIDWGVSYLNESEFKACYTSLIQAILAESPDTRIILQSIFPVTEDCVNLDNAKIDTANGWVKDIAAENGCRYLDTQSVLKDEEGYLKAEYCSSTDGIHLNKEAYEVILAYVRTHALLSDQPEDDGPEYRVQANNYKLPFVIGYCSDDYDPNIYFDNTNSSPTYALGEAAYQRIKQTEKHLGVDISVKSMGNYTAYASAIKSAVMAGGSPCDMLLTNGSYGITDLMISNCLTDLPELDSLNLQAGYWDGEGMEALAVKGKQYLAAGDFLLPESSYVMVFDKKLAAREGLDTHLYTLVQDHGWTLGKMAEYVSLFSGDSTGDGKLDERDEYGLACNVWTTLIPFVTSSDITMIRQGGRDGMSMDWVGYGIDWQIMELDDLLYALLEGDHAYTYWPTGSKPAVGVSSGHIFMEPTYLGDLPRINASGADVGILPYPLYDRDQDEYRTLYMDGYIAVPNSVRHTDMVGDTIETLAYRSEAVRAAYLDYLLGDDAEERLMDAVMLETVCGSLTYDPVRYLYTTSSKIEKLMYILPHHAAGVRGSAQETLTSAEIEAAARDLKAFLKSIVSE